MSDDDLQPVLIGAATAQQRIAEPGGGLDVTGLIIEAARQAVADTGASGVAPAVDWIGATRGLSMLPDAARRVAEALGRDDQVMTTAADVGIPQQTLVNRALDAIRTGAAEIAIVCGGEAKHRDDVARRAGVTLPGHDQVDLVPDHHMAPEGEIVAAPEIEIGMVAPVQQYAAIDSARRFAEGWTNAEHRTDIAELWQRFNQVAVENPRADFGQPMTVAEIRDPGLNNRAMAAPYNKWHNSQWGVDQAAALVFCSVATARRLGVDADRWVFPHLGLESSLSLSLSRRQDLHRWPAMQVLGRAAAAHIGRAIADIEHVELYSCFPVAVRVQQRELGLDPDATPTLTGGMAFAGGPFNNFVYQSTVSMIEQLRAQPGSYGAVTAVSGLLTKPALAVWSTEPPGNGLLLADLVDDARRATAESTLDEEPDGPGRVAAYTVVYADDAPAEVRAVIDLDSGDRAVAAAADAELAARSVDEELIGATVRVVGRSFEA